MINYFDFFNAAKDTFDPAVGFGLSEMVTAITNSMKLVNFRDRSFTLKHPRSTSYDGKKAQQEKVDIVRITERFCVERGLVLRPQ